MQLDQAIQDLFRKQEGILGEYAAGLRSLCADQKALVNLLLQERKGMAVIDSGFVASKATQAYTLTNDNTLGGTALTLPIQVWRLDLRGAKKIALSFSSAGSGPTNPFDGGMDGAFGAFSTSPSDTIPLSEYALLGRPQFAGLYNGGTGLEYQTQSFFSLTDCATAKFLYVFFVIYSGDAVITFGSDAGAWPTYQLLA